MEQPATAAPAAMEQLQPGATGTLETASGYTGREAADSTEAPPPPPLLLTLPLDVWGTLLGLLEPAEVCRFAATSQQALGIAAKRRTSVLLARSLSRVRLSSVRGGMRARETFAASASGLPQLVDSRAACQAGIVEALQRSPDPIADLAAAVQRGLGLVLSEKQHAAHVLAPLRADLVRCANFVCLLSWRLHMRAVRRQAAAARAGGGGGAGPAAVQQEEGAAAGDAAVQTELGPSLAELQELLDGLSSLMAPTNPSVAFSRASCHLLRHLLQQQGAAWNLQPPPGAAGAAAGGAEQQEDEEDEAD